LKTFLNFERTYFYIIFALLIEQPTLGFGGICYVTFMEN